MATKHLELVLKGEWYDKIESGEKRHEYRRLTAYWWRRIFSSPWNFYHNGIGGFDFRHNTVRFRRGYGKNAPSMIFKIGLTGHIVIPPAEVQAEVGADPVIRIFLLERIS